MSAIIEKAQVHLPTDREVEVTRSFRAPRALVYRAWTEPALLQQWMLGPPGWSMPVCEMDVRKGGSYRWRWREDGKDTEFGFSGEFHEVVPGTRIVHTEVFDAGSTGVPGSGGQALVTVDFSEANGITTVTTRIDYGSREGRDAALQTGMTDGMEQSYQLLDRMLAQRRTA